MIFTSNSTNECCTRNINRIRPQRTLTADEQDQSEASASSWLLVKASVTCALFYCLVTRTAAWLPQLVVAECRGSRVVVVGAPDDSIEMTGHVQRGASEVAIATTTHAPLQSHDDHPSKHAEEDAMEHVGQEYVLGMAELE